MVFWIFSGLAVYLVNVYMAGILLIGENGLRLSLGPRDTLAEPSVYHARILKSAANYAENLPVFLTFGVLAIVVEGADMAQAVLGAQIFVFARIAYLAVYISGVPLIRTLVFMVSMVGLGIMAASLL